MKEHSIEMIWVDIQDLNPAPYNPRNITDRAFEGLKESIKKFGFVDPIIVNTTTGNIVGGHQRLKAAQALNLKRVPVVEISVSEIEEKALNVTLNNQAISGHYTDVLQDLLTEIKVELDEDFSKSILLDDLVIKDAWYGGERDVDNVEENLDGIMAKITIRCPQEGKSEVMDFIKEKLKEHGFDNVEVG